MKEEQYIVLVEKLDTLQKGVDQIDSDLGKDRSDLQEFRIELGNLTLQIEELRKGQKNQVEKIQDKVADVVEPVRQQAQDLTDAIEDATIVKVKEKKVPFWKGWF